MVTKLIDALQVNHVLDYGCGETCELSKHLKPERDFRYQAYDANVEEFAEDPVPAEMVVCLDDLSRLGSVQCDHALDEIERLTQQVLFCTISTDVMPLEYWLPKIMDRFALQRVQVVDNNVCIVAYSLGLPDVSH